MKFRQISIVLGAAVLVGFFVAGSKLSSMKKDTPIEKGNPPAKLVKSTIITNTDVIPQTEVLGRLVAKNNIEVFAEVSGRLMPSTKEFREGVRFKKGEVLMHIDDEEARMSMLAQKSSFMQLLTSILADIKTDFPESYDQWAAYINGFSIDSSLANLPNPKSQQEKFFLSNKNVFNQYFSIKSAEARLAKYTILAPFDGIVSSSSINSGTLVRLGQRMGSFFSPEVFELEGAVNILDLKFLKNQDKIAFTSNELDGSWEGKIIRISEYIDPTTQSAKVFAEVTGKDLREGMYVSGIIQSDHVSESVELPSNLIFDKHKIYAIRDNALKEIDVDILKIGNGKAIIRGLENGERILGEPINRAYDGMKVNWEEE